MGSKAEAAFLIQIDEKNKMTVKTKY